MPIPARVVSDLLMAALSALLHMSTQCCSPTLDDVSKRSTLLAIKKLVIGLWKPCVESLKDIRQFQMWLGHDVAVGSTEELVSSRSRGLIVERSDNVDTCR
jgi:hypothetical protein